MWPRSGEIGTLNASGGVIHWHSFFRSQFDICQTKNVHTETPVRIFPS